MATVQDYFVQSQAAFAAYATLSAGIPSVSALATEGAGMSDAQAETFARDWRVVDQFTDSSGASATIFQRDEQLYLAIRGTQFEAGDLLVDGLLALGVSSLLNPQFNALKAKIDQWLAEGGPLHGQSFSVTGHSLGGYLAAAIKETYATNVTEAYLFNAPGSGGLFGNIADLVSGVFSQSAPGANGVWNIKASEGLSIISGLGSQPSAQIPVQIEDDGLGLANHSVVRLTDALAIQTLYATLAPSLTPAQLNALVDASGNPMDQTLESALDSLRKLLFGNDVTTTPVGDRNAFYTNLYGLMGSSQYTSLAGASGTQVTVLAGKTASEIISLAANDGAQGLAARYALVALNHFALTGANYSGFNANGALNLYNAQTQENGLTQQYLADRANFLERKLWFSTEDKNPVDPLAVFDPQQPASFANESSSNYFLDFASGYQIRLGPLFPSTHVCAFGGSHSDLLTGQSLDDHLFGGAGSDILTGGEGDDDYMEGGVGLDVYQFTSGDGMDAVLDADGEGVLVRNGNAIALGIRQDETHWTFDSTTYTKVGTDLEITFADDATDKITVRDFDFTGASQDGYLAIRLVDAPIVPQNPVRTFFGDKQDFDSDTAEPGVQTQADAFGNLVRADGQDSRPHIAEADRADVFFGSTGAEVERFTTGGGNDQVNADGVDSATSTAGGRDLIETGAGRDIVAAGADDDWIEGGADADILSGNAGDDTIYADTSGTDQLADISAAIAAGSGAGTGQQGDWLAGGAGADILIGGANDDVLTGGQGVDLLIGGAGADSLLGDSTYVATALGWSYTDSAGQRIFTPVVGEASALAGAADEIYGGSGDDFIRGGRGDDVIYGEADRDDIAGEEGADVIFGGDGNDDLSGDASYVAGAEHGADYIDGGAGDDKIAGEGGDDVIFGGSGDDVILGDSASLDTAFHRADFIDGGDGDDAIRGGGGDDILLGGEGVDVLVGDAGNDQLEGGAGADILNGGEGDDRYVADATDTIEDDAGANTIALADGDDPESWLIRETVVDNQPQVVLVLANQTPEAGGPPGLKINGRFEGFSFEFANGEVLPAGEFIYRTATEGGAVAGTDADDVLIGTRFEDRLNGQGGNDVLDGREGNDQLLGGEGDDVYLFDLGFGPDRIEEFADFGFDTVHFGPDISAADVSVARRANGDLVLSLSPQDEVTIAGQYGDGSKIEQIEFGDGVSLTLAELDALPIAPIVGTDGADTLLGTEAGDTIEGRRGLDTYALGYGLGRDTFIDTDGRIVLQTGLDFDALRAFRQGDDLALVIRGTSEGANLKDYFVSAQSWTIEDAVGAQTTPQAIVDATAAREQDWLNTQRDEYRYSVRAQIIQRHLFPGSDVEVVSDGVLRRPWQRSPGALQVSGSGSWTTSDITTTIHSADGTVTVLPSHTSDSAWSTGTIRLSEINNTIVNETLRSDDAFIFGDSGRFEDAPVVEQVVATVIWDRRTADQQAEYSTTTAGLLPGGGYFTSTARYSSFSGTVEGRAVDFAPVGTVNANSGLFPERVNALYIVDHATWRIVDINAGPSNNEISNGDVIDAGAGNDVIWDGGFAYGGAGNDIIFALVAAGGPGDDFIGQARRSLILPQDSGHDTIHNTDGINEFQLADWYYASIGIPDWEARLFDPDTEDFLSIEEGIELGLLPALPPITPHDYAALAPLYAAGVIEQDSLEIGPGIALDDLTLSWKTIGFVSPLDGDLGPYVVLNVGINPDNVASLVIPRSDDLLGAGIEEVRFADGTVVSLGDLIALAPPVPDFDPAFVPNLGPIFVFESGDGVRFIDDPGVTTIQFGAGISADLLTLGLGSLLIRVGDQGDAIHLIKFDPNDAFSSQIQNLVFADGSELTYGEVVARGFDLFGTEGDDFLSGTNATDRLHGGAGNDFYFFAPGSGGDTVEDEAGDFDTVFLGGSIAPASVAVTRADEFLTLGLNSADHIAIRWQPDAGYQIEEVRFSDGTAWDAATLESMATTAQNTAPTLANAIADQSAQEDEAFSFILPTGTFADTDPGDMLSIGATLADGTPLPAWLVFDVTTQSFNGIPTNDDVGSFDVAVTATDGGGLSVGDVFTLAVTNTNDAPSFGAAFSNQFGNQNAPFEFALPPIRRNSGHRGKEPDEEGRLESLIESWFGRARDRAIPLSAFLDGEDAGHGEHRRGGHSLPHSTQDEIAASWRRTAVLLEVHLSSHDLAASDHREGAGASTLFGGHELVPEQMGARLARASGHDLQRFGGLAEGFSKLKG